MTLKSHICLLSYILVKPVKAYDDCFVIYIYITDIVGGFYGDTAVDNVRSIGIKMSWIGGWSSSQGFEA